MPAGSSRAFRSPRFAAIRRHWIAEGNHAVFLAVSPVPRDALERQRATIECVELPHAYDHLFALARKVARRISQNRGMKLSGLAVPLRRRYKHTGERSLVAILAAADVSELLVMHNVAAMGDTERAAFFAARCGCADVSVQDTGA